MVPQEQGEAKANVRTRLEFIKREISLVGCETYQHHRKHVDAQIKNGQGRSGKKKNEVWNSPAFLSGGFDCRIATCRNPNQVSAGLGMVQLPMYDWSRRDVQELQEPPTPSIVFAIPRDQRDP